jgi:hypothetical protein
VGILEVGFKQVFIQEPGLTQFQARQSVISEVSTQALHVAATVKCGPFDGYAVVEYKRER